MTYTLTEMSADSARALHQHRRNVWRKRVYGTRLWRILTTTHAIFCLPIRAVMYSRIGKSSALIGLASAVATQVYA